MGRELWGVCLCTSLAACGSPSDGSGTTSFSADVWADNWFAMYVDGELVAEDSVSITTERSFNAESFSFEATPPFQIGAILKDYKEDDSGLEYIGEPNQQMGDGGFIAQIRSGGDVAVVSDASWSCLVVHRAPLDASCVDDVDPSSTCTAEIVEEPDGWKELEFDDSDWSSAIEWAESDVDPKDGYDEIDWSSDAKLIWGSDLEKDNTLLCRIAVS